MSEQGTISLLDSSKKNPIRAIPIKPEATEPESTNAKRDKRARQ